MVGLQSDNNERIETTTTNSIKAFYESYFPEDKTQTNLANWEKFEEKNPNTFIGMYQFWVSKNK